MLLILGPVLRALLAGASEPQGFVDSIEVTAVALSQVPLQYFVQKLESQNHRR